MHTRENGFMSSSASMHWVLAFPKTKKLRVHHPTLWVFSNHLKRHLENTRVFGALGTRGKGVAKEDLAQWVLVALKKSKTLVNIMKGFFATFIWPSNRSTMDDKMGSSEGFMMRLRLMRKRCVMSKWRRRLEEGRWNSLNIWWH